MNPFRVTGTGIGAVALLIAVLLSGTVLPGCQPPESIRIGFVGGASGRVADLGIAGRDASAQRQDQQSVKEAILATHRFEGVQESILLNEFGEVKRSLFITVVHDGQFVVVK